MEHLQTPLVTDDAKEIQQPPNGPAIESVNFHLWQPCNMHCRFCFATFHDARRNEVPDGHLAEEESVEVVRQLGRFGFRKLNLAGGEPFLCPWIHRLVATANEEGMITSVVTNGSLVTPESLLAFNGTLDWFALSVDSIDPKTNKDIGRVVGRDAPMTADQYIALCSMARRLGSGVKVNTVVSSANYQEYMTDFINRANPYRWKIMQVLPVEDQQKLRLVQDLFINDKQFEHFVGLNQPNLNWGIGVVIEKNEDMTGSYAMVDPAGRFFDNVDGRYRYGPRILDVGVAEAIRATRLYADRFEARGGNYNAALPANVRELSVDDVLHVIEQNAPELVNSVLDKGIATDPFATDYARIHGYTLASVKGSPPYMFAGRVWNRGHEMYRIGAENKKIYFLSDPYFRQQAMRTWADPAITEKDVLEAIDVYCRAHRSSDEAVALRKSQNEDWMSELDEAEASQDAQTGIASPLEEQRFGKLVEDTELSEMLRQRGHMPTDFLVQRLLSETLAVPGHTLDSVLHEEANRFGKELLQTLTATDGGHAVQLEYRWGSLAQQPVFPFVFSEPGTPIEAVRQAVKAYYDALDCWVPSSSLRPPNLSQQSWAARALGKIVNRFR